MEIEREMEGGKEGKRVERKGRDVRVGREVERGREIERGREKGKERVRVCRIDR